MKSRWAVLWWSRRGTGWQIHVDCETISIFNTKAEADTFAKGKRDEYKADPVFYKAGPWTVARIAWPGPPRGAK